MVTRKKKTKVMTIPQLRKAFETIEQKSKEIHSVREFQQVWKSVFHKTIDVKAAESYLSMKKKRSKTRKSKNKQSGGVAPLDYTVGPGVNGVHGNFLPYISSGFGFYNSINNIAMDSDCGKQDITPTLSSDMGSNKVISGGSLNEILSQRYVASTVPPTPLQDFLDSARGVKLGASPDPLQTKFEPSRV
jgi:uncharacterized protein (UPF0335 family)